MPGYVALRILSPCRASDLQGDIHITVFAQHRQVHVVGMPVQNHIDAGVAEAQIAQFQFIELVGQDRTLETDLAPDAVDAQAETGLQQKERRGRGPGLRRAR